MDFTVVVPFLDEEKMLPGCLEALGRQSYPAASVEWIFVDNASSDRSAEIVRREPRVRLLRCEPQDPYLARNAALDQAQGRWIAFTDADCRPDEHWLAELAKAMEEGADVVIGRLVSGSRSGRELLFSLYYETKCELILAENRRRYFFGHAGNMAIRRSVFDEIGPFRAMPVVGDTEILHRLIETRPAARILYRPSALVSHLDNDGWSSLRAQRSYGEFSAAVARVSAYRPLPLSVNFRVFWRCVTKRRLSPWKAAQLLFILWRGRRAFRRGYRDQVGGD